MNYDEIAKSAGDDPFKAQQKWTELSQLLEFLAPRKPKSILEIGVYKGGTVMAWTHIADDEARIFGIDLPGGEFGGGFTTEEAMTISKLWQRQQSIDLFGVDSHKQSTIDMISQYAPFDFIFIDGDHTYEGAKQDYESYYPMLSENGVMAFHDIVEHTNRDVKVHLLWEELKQKNKVKEFIDSDFPTDHGSWGGIGVLL